MKKKFLIPFLIIDFVIIVLFGIAWKMSSMVMYPKPNCFQEHHVFCNSPKEIGLNFDDVRFPSKDGIILKAWFIPSQQESERAIILVHGHGGDRRGGLRYSKALFQANFHQLLLELRGVDWENRFVSMGYHEKKDIKAAVDYLIKSKGIIKIGVFGFSMGASTSILAMEEDERIKAGIFSSGYSHALDQLAESSKRMFGIPRFPLLPISVWLLNFRGNMKLEDVVPEKSIENISPRPVYIFHCDKDNFVYYSHAKRLFSSAKEPKQLYTANCNVHERIWNVNSQKAEKIAIEFFQKYLN